MCTINVFHKHSKKREQNFKTKILKTNFHMWKIQNKTSLYRNISSTTTFKVQTYAFVNTLFLLLISFIFSCFKMDLNDAECVLEPKSTTDIMLEHRQMSEMGLPLQFGRTKRKRKSNSIQYPFVNTNHVDQYSEDIEDIVDEIQTIKLSNNAYDYLCLEKSENGSQMEESMDDLEENVDISVGGNNKRKKKKKSKNQKKPKDTPSNYWRQRELLFSRFRQGIRLDKESWYSVTPESIAQHIAERILNMLIEHYSPNQQFVILDCMCGAGGNTIQFALSKSVSLVIAVDIDPKKIEIAKHNATIYNCSEKIQFITGDYLQLINGNCFKNKIDCCFLSPPWGGPNYQKTEKYSLNQMIPNGFDICRLSAKYVTKNIAILLPRNIDLDEMETLSKLIYRCDDETTELKVEVEQNILSNKVKTMTAYFGKLINPNNEPENDSIAN